MDSIKPANIKINSIFILNLPLSDYLTKILQKVLSKISIYVDIYKMDLGYLQEGNTITGELAEVTKDGYINLDSNILKEYDEEISMAIIAHEIAHCFHKHYLDTKNLMKKEYEADKQAKEWGFNVDKFRKDCGPPTLC